MEDARKYPRTCHLWYSPGTTSEDRLLTQEETLSMFSSGREIVVTEKLDGENTSLYRDGLHARSMDSRTHPSRNWIANLQATIGFYIDKGWRICGENMFAKHSIYYDRLPSFFFVFSVWNDKNVALSWDETQFYLDYLNECAGLTGEYALRTVPVLYRGPWDEKMVRACWTGVSKYGNEQEGYVVRIADSFPFPEPTKENEMPVFKTLSKFVRERHVQTDDHWRATWTPNKLAVQSPHA